MAADVILHRVWPPASPDCTATKDGQHWPFPGPRTATWCAACGQQIPAEQT